jgi:hypothetical protein
MSPKRGLIARHQMKGGSFCVGSGSAPATRGRPVSKKTAKASQAVKIAAKTPPSHGVCRGCAARRGLTKAGVTAPHVLRGGVPCAGSGKTPKTGTAARKLRVIRPPRGIWGESDPIAPSRPAPDARKGFWSPGKPWNAKRTYEE